MTGNEIRAIASVAIERKELADFESPYWLAEIAAQLSDMNDRLEVIANLLGAKL
jgi:hypothetical protein